MYLQLDTPNQILFDTSQLTAVTARALPALINLSNAAKFLLLLLIFLPLLHPGVPHILVSFWCQSFVLLDRVRNGSFSVFRRLFLYFDTATFMSCLSMGHGKSLLVGFLLPRASSNHAVIVIRCLSVSSYLSDNTA